MILHYLKIAWRNLLKYRMQTAVSVLGLAAGFVCFALSAFWIHYEMTYDSFRRDADRLYVARVNDGYKAGKMTERLPVPMAAYLTEHYPEVESAAYSGLRAKGLRWTEWNGKSTCRRQTVPGYSCSMRSWWTAASTSCRDIPTR